MRAMHDASTPPGGGFVRAMHDASTPPCLVVFRGGFHARDARRKHTLRQGRSPGWVSCARCTPQAHPPPGSFSGVGFVRAMHDASTPPDGAVFRGGFCARDARRKQTAPRDRFPGWVSCARCTTPAPRRMYDTRPRGNCAALHETPRGSGVRSRWRRETPVWRGCARLT